MLPRTAADDNEPTNPKLWEKCKAKAKSRYTKWPSAYAVGHALKLYKDEGGGWKKTAGETTKIDPAWVKGIRAWVKKTFAPKPRYASLDDIIAHLKTLRDKDLNRFWEYLFYTKGLLPHGVDPELIIERFRAKIAEELKAARELLDADLTKIQHTRDAMTPGTHTYRLDQQQGPQWSVLGFYERINPADPFGAALKGYEDVAKETLAKVEDTLSGKLLRAITAFLGKYADGQPFESEEILLEYTIGKVKLVYDGEPDRYIINRPDPGDPRGLSDYIPYLKKVKALLEQKGFGNLWYGPIFIGCPKCGGENPQGKHFGVGAHYLRGPDHVVVYLEPKPFLVELLIHELGHRYYFKFMDAGDRARFDSYFKEVAAVSEYGGTTTQEDFAEVFAHFVLGRDMTRDQIERFKAFLAKKDRGRFASPVRVSSLPAKIPASVLYDGGWEWDMGGFANWPSFETKPKSEQIAWAKEFLGSGLREPVDVTVWADGQASFQDGHHRVMAGKVLGLEIPVRISFRNFNPDYWPALFELLKAGYSRRDYNPQGWSLKRSGVPPLEVVRRGRGEADQWIMDHDVPPSRSASALASRVASRYLAGEDRKYKMPRKFDREHCESKSCDEMGFTEKASCRPYKNCYRGASEVTRVEVTTEWAEGLQKWVDTAFPPLELNEWPTVDGAISRIGTYQRNLNNLWDNINYTQGLKSLETGIRYKGVESVPKRDLDLAVNEEFKSAQKILSAIAEPILRNRGYYLHEPYVSRFNKKLETLRAVLKNRVLGKIRDFLRSEGGSIERPRRTLQLTIGDMSVVLKSPDMPPGYLEKYIQYFKKAKALLDQKGFGDLWYGTAFVDCPKCGGENQHGKHLGVAAHYLRVPDHIVVFLEPHPFMVELLIHELGHRYYFKVMDRGDRARFDSYFKEVAAVSEYGGTVTEEDFAEVFAHFVLGRGMTRDQIERFKAFLAKKDRGRFASAAPRYLSAKGKARKDVGHGGLDEWFSGHGQGKDKAPGEAQWGDWVAISPVKRTVTREDGTKKTYEPGDIIGPCGALTDDPDWKDLTRGGKTPFKCMARPKAHDMPKDERAEKAREKMKVQEKAPKGKKPVNTPTFKDDE